MTTTDLLDSLDIKLRDEFNHHIEQIEFQADYPYRLQECIDLVETLRRNLSGQLHITCLRVDLDGSTEFVITTNLDWAHLHCRDIHAEVIAEESIEEVIDRQYGGIAALTFLG